MFASIDSSPLLSVSRRSRRARIRTTPMVRQLLSQPIIESGLAARQIASAIKPPIPAGTIARLGTTPPKSISCDQLLMAAHVVQSQGTADASDVIAILRDPHGSRSSALRQILAARIIALETKGELELADHVRTLVTSARRIYIFDRGYHIPYLCPQQLMDEDDSERARLLKMDVTKSCWLFNPGTPRYERSPRIFVNITLGSLNERVDSYGDFAVEHLIGNVESLEHSLCIVNDSARLAHRVFRGLFAHAAAAVIIDHTAAIILPMHCRSIRLYESHVDGQNAGFIKEAIRHFRQMRKFRMHPASDAGVIALLRQHLTYQLPWWTSPYTQSRPARCVHQYSNN